MLSKAISAALILVFCTLGAAEPLSLQTEARRDFDATDAKLRAAYDDLVAVLDVGQRRELAALQERWLEFRESAAQTTASLAGTTEPHQQLLEILERRKLTEERLEALQRIRNARSAPNSANSR